jgi:hypothetical protein
MTHKQKIFLLALAAALPTTGIWFFEPIAQDKGYHCFADHRGFFGVPNFMDVVSNIGFVFVGVLGMWRLGQPSAAGWFHDPREGWVWRVIFLGVALTGIGSGYYHLDPTSPTLVWDRLPMTLVTTPIFAALVCERISVRGGLALLGPLVLAGMGSVAYWAWSEAAGRGDLRPYALAQYLPLLLVPLVLGLFGARYTRAAGYLWAVGWYALAKLGEELDGRIFALGGLVSGHTLKHLLAAVALYGLLRMLELRRMVGA